jgi:hypothetical protein
MADFSDFLINNLKSNLEPEEIRILKNVSLTKLLHDTLISSTLISNPILFKPILEENEEQQKKLIKENFHKTLHKLNLVNNHEKVSDFLARQQDKKSTTQYHPTLHNADDNNYLVARNSDQSDFILDNLDQQIIVNPIYETEFAATTVTAFDNFNYNKTQPRHFKTFAKNKSPVIKNQTLIKPMKTVNNSHLQRDNLDVFSGFKNPNVYEDYLDHHVQLNPNQNNNFSNPPKKTQKVLIIPNPTLKPLKKESSFSLIKVIRSFKDLFNHGTTNSGNNRIVSTVPAKISTNKISALKTAKNNMTTINRSIYSKKKSSIYSSAANNHHNKKILNAKISTQTNTQNQLIKKRMSSRRSRRRKSKTYITKAVASNLNTKLKQRRKSHKIVFDTISKVNQIQYKLANSNQCLTLKNKNTFFKDKNKEKLLGNWDKVLKKAQKRPESLKRLLETNFNTNINLNKDKQAGRKTSIIPKTATTRPQIPSKTVAQKLALKHHTQNPKVLFQQEKITPPMFKHQTNRIHSSSGNIPKCTQSKVIPIMNTKNKSDDNIHMKQRTAQIISNTNIHNNKVARDLDENFRTSLISILSGTSRTTMTKIEIQQCVDRSDKNKIKPKNDNILTSKYSKLNELNNMHAVAAISHTSSSSITTNQKNIANILKKMPIKSLSTRLNELQQYKSYNKGFNLSTCSNSASSQVKSSSRSSSSMSTLTSNSTKNSIRRLTIEPRIDEECKELEIQIPTPVQLKQEIFSSMKLNESQQSEQKSVKKYVKDATSNKVLAKKLLSQLKAETKRKELIMKEEKKQPLSSPVASEEKNEDSETNTGGNNHMQMFYFRPESPSKTLAKTLLKHRTQKFLKSFYYHVNQTLNISLLKNSLSDDNPQLIPSNTDENRNDLGLTKDDELLMQQLQQNIFKTLLKSSKFHNLIPTSFWNASEINEKMGNIRLNPEKKAGSNPDEEENIEDEEKMHELIRKTLNWKTLKHIISYKGNDDEFLGQEYKKNDNIEKSEELEEKNEPKLLTDTDIHLPELTRNFKNRDKSEKEKNNEEITLKNDARISLGTNSSGSTTAPGTRKKNVPHIAPQQLTTQMLAAGAAAPPTLSSKNTYAKKKSRILKRTFVKTAAKRSNRLTISEFDSPSVHFNYYNNNMTTVRSSKQILKELSYGIIQNIGTVKSNRSNIVQYNV